MPRKAAAKPEPKPKPKPSPKKSAPRSPRKPAAKVEVKARKGRRKAPVEKRRILSDRPHRGRISEPDLPSSALPGFSPLPEEPPHSITAEEREAWDFIVKPQISKGESAWLFADDIPFILAVCSQYRAWRRAYRELNLFYSKSESGGLRSLIDPETGQPHRLINLEKQLVQAYQAGLRSIGLEPINRKVIEAKDDDDPEGGLA